MFARISLMALACILTASAAIVAQDVGEEFVPKIGDQLCVQLQDQVAETWARMSGEVHFLKKGNGWIAHGVITQVHPDGQFSFEVSKETTSEDGVARLHKLSAKIGPDDPAIVRFRERPGTPGVVWRDMQPPLVTAIRLANQNDVTIRSWTLVEEVKLTRQEIGEVYSRPEGIFRRIP